METTIDRLPEIHETLFSHYLPHWHMVAAERCALITLLDAIKPECAIEIGTAQGGSLSVLAHFSQQVFTLDVDPTCRTQLGALFSNVEFITGDSRQTLPALLQRLQAAHTRLGFVLIDGDHSRRGVQQDIENVIQYQPLQPLYIVLHDSFNPDCREGMLQANWAASPYVHSVELDFVSGVLLSHPDRYREMWGGLAVARLSPQPRQGALVIQTSEDLLFQEVKRQFISHRRLDHRARRLWPRLRQKLSPRD